MKIIECFMKNNDIYKKDAALYPTGIVVHSTAVNQTALARYVAPCDDDPKYHEIVEEIGTNIYSNSWNRPGVDKLVHFMIGYGKNPADGVKIAQTEPCDRKCGGVGVGPNGSYNSSHIQFEMLEDDHKNRAYFDEVIHNAVELCAKLCLEWDIPVANICSHKECADRGFGSQHGDPENWLGDFGKDMDWFRGLVQEKLNEMTAPDTQPDEPEKADGDMFSGKWWKATAVRMVRTFAETLLGGIGASALLSEVAWLECLSAASLAALVALLFAIISLPEAKK